MISKKIAASLLVTVLGLGCVSAGAPKKQPIGRYVSLWTNSPFTVKPDVEPPPEIPNALEDYVLTGVSKLPDGYFVVLMNKKKREERIRIAPNEQNTAGFTVVDVKQDPYDYMKTTVEISVGGGRTGVVSYEEKFLTLKTAAPQKKPSSNTKRTSPPTPPGVRPPTNPRTPTSPRVRRVPTPTKR